METESALDTVYDNRFRILLQAVGEFEKLPAAEGAQGSIRPSRGPKPEAKYVKLTRVADDGQLRFSRGDADTSKPFNLTKVEGERPYYKKNTQATGGALLHSGNAGSSRFDAKSVAAAHQSLENLENSLPNAPAEVKAMLGSLRGLLQNMAKGAPVFVGGKQIDAKNFVTSLASNLSNNPAYGATF